MRNFQDFGCVDAFQSVILRVISQQEVQCDVDRVRECSFKVILLHALSRSTLSIRSI